MAMLRTMLHDAAAIANARLSFEFACSAGASSCESGSPKLGGASLSTLRSAST